MAADKRLKFRHRQRLTEEMPLIGVATRARQKFSLRISFNTFGNNPQAQTVCQGDDVSGNGGIVRIDQLL